MLIWCSLFGDRVGGIMPSWDHIYLQVISSGSLLLYKQTISKSLFVACAKKVFYVRLLLLLGITADFHSISSYFKEIGAI